MKNNIDKLSHLNILTISRSVVFLEKQANFEQTLKATTQNRKGSITNSSNTKLNSSSQSKSNPLYPTEQEKIVENPVNNIPHGGINAY